MSNAENAIHERRRALQAEFMKAMRGYPTHKVSKALNRMTPGVNWNKCPKSHMAQAYARENALLPGESHRYAGLQAVDLKALEAKIRESL